jgi:hypothetical protein
MLFLRARDMSRSYGPFRWCRDGAPEPQASGNMARCTHISVFSGTHCAGEYVPASTGQLPGVCRARCVYSRGGAVSWTLQVKLSDFSELHGGEANT